MRKEAKAVSPAKAQRLKRNADEERRGTRRLKFVLIAIAAGVAIIFVVFCAWYTEWIKQPHENGVSQHNDH